MTDILTQHYGKTEGPFGLPMTDAAARALDLRLRELPREEPYTFRRANLARGLSELQPGERADVSWITEESPDRQGDIVLARGMDDSHFQLNPLVTLNHAYWAPPVGRSVWRKKVREGDYRGVKAKTQYPSRPDSFPGDERWFPDYAFALVQAGLLKGKSIGFLPLKARTPTAEETRSRPELSGVRLIYEDWLLLEYACCFLPTQQHAVVTEVSKSLEVPAMFWKALAPDGLQPALAFTALAEIEGWLGRRLAALEWGALVEKAVQVSVDRARGRV